MRTKNRYKKQRVPHSPSGLFDQGLKFYLEKNKPDAALSCFLKAAKLGYAKAYSKIGIILYREKCKAEEAEKWFMKAELAGDLTKEATYEYGMLHYLYKKKWETGLEYLLRSATLGYKLAYGDIGAILYLCKTDLNEAEEWFKKAEEADCLLGPPAFYYGLLLYLDRDHWNKSKKYFEQAAEDGYEPAFAAYASLLYLNQNNVEEAEKWFKKAVDANELPGPHAHTYGTLLIDGKNDIELGQKYLDKAALEGYRE